MTTPVAGKMSVVTMAVREGLGIPGMVMGASFLGFGSMVHESGFELWVGLASTFSGWALPGQIAMVELYGIGASLTVITLAVLFTNARLLPLTVTLFPHLNLGTLPRWRVYLLSHLIAVTSWAVAMRRCPELPDEHRLPFFTAFAATLWTLSMACTAAGYALSGAVPAPVSLGLVFLNPVYFMLLLAAERLRYRLLAIGAGALLGPAIHLFAPDWSLVVGGFAAGTLAFAVERWRRP